MTPLELAAMLITAATTLKNAGMTLEKDPSKNFSDLATLVAIAYAENEQGENIGTGQSTLVDEEGKQELSFGPFQINRFWYKDRSASGDTTVVNNEYTDIFKDVEPGDMPDLLKDPMNSAIAAVIVANSNKGYENWSVYNKDVYGIKDQSFKSEYWKTGFRSAAEELYQIDIPEVDTGNTVVTPPEEPTVMEEGALGMERRATGYSQREVSRFNKAVDKIAAMINKVEGSDNPETKRQVQIILGQELGFDMDNLPQPQRSSYDEVDRTIIDFVAELGKQKAKLGG